MEVTQEQTQALIKAMSNKGLTPKDGMVVHMLVSGDIPAFIEELKQHPNYRKNQIMAMAMNFYKTHPQEDEDLDTDEKLELEEASMQS